jgi:hypothetical protein
MGEARQSNVLGQEIVNLLRAILAELRGKGDTK